MSNWTTAIQKLFPQISIQQESDKLLHLNNSIYLHRDIWESRQQQVISRLDSLFNQNPTSIFARNTTISEIDQSTAREFIDANHLMGFAGGKFYYGLRDDTELVAVAVFSKILFMKYETPQYYSAELVRYCSLMGSTVVGGLDKLIKTFIQDHPVDDIVTSIDKEWSDGSSYLKLGFEKINETEPIIFVVSTRDWTRAQIKGKIPTDVEPRTYLVSNQGNIKLRLSIPKQV